MDTNYMRQALLSYWVFQTPIWWHTTKFSGILAASLLLAFDWQPINSTASQGDLKYVNCCPLQCMCMQQRADEFFTPAGWLVNLSDKVAILDAASPPFDWVKGLETISVNRLWCESWCGNATKARAYRHGMLGVIREILNINVFQVSIATPIYTETII